MERTDAEGGEAEREDGGERLHADVLHLQQRTVKDSAKNCLFIADLDIKAASLVVQRPPETTKYNNVE